MQRKRNWMWIWIAAVVVVSVAAFVLGFFVRSRNEVAIENSQQQVAVTTQVAIREFQPPTPQLTAVVSKPQQVQLFAPQSDGDAIVTSHRKAAGDSVRSGQLIATISGNPLFVFDLPFPLYRDLNYLDRGEDVRALQQALAAAGYYSGNADGIYGSRTARAVRALYVSNNLKPPAVAGSEEAEANATVEAASGAPSDASSDGLTSGSDAGAVATSQTPEGGYLPRSSVARVTFQEGVVVTLAQVGTVLDAQTPLALLDAGRLQATVRVPVSDKDHFAKNAKVKILGQDGAALTTGTVTSVSEFSTQLDEQRTYPGYDVTIALDSTDNLDAGVEVIIEPSDGEAAKSGKAVPLTAVREDSNSSYVLRDNGTRVDVVVEQVQDSWALIASEDLAEGDKVQVAVRL